MSTLTDEIARRRTFAIISHPDAGKTTLTEKLLLFGGAIQLAGEVKARGGEMVVERVVPRLPAVAKQPDAIAVADRRLMALAGLWENWRSPAGEWVRSFAIITTTPNELCAELHNRMPVVLGPETWPTWLGEEPADPRQLKALLAPTHQTR